MVVGDFLGEGFVVRFLSEVKDLVIGDSLGEEMVWLLEIY